MIPWNDPKYPARHAAPTPPPRPDRPAIAVLAGAAVLMAVILALYTSHALATVSLVPFAP